YCAYATYIYVIYRKKDSEQKDIPVSSKRMSRLLMKSALGILLILVFSDLLVDTVIEIGQRVSINESVIGLFVLALGTNVPELIILYRAREVDQVKLAIGNFFGSAAINTALLGVLTLLAHGVDLSINTA